MSRSSRPNRIAFLIAVIVTALALPVVWLIEGAEPTIETTTEIPDDYAPTEPLGTLGGALSDPNEIIAGQAEDPGATPSTVVIAVPTEQRSASGRASYRSTITSPDLCVATPAPFGRRVRVMNLNNGRSVTCRAAISPVGAPVEVVLHTSAFVQIADLVNAPIPVEISW